MRKYLLTLILATSLTGCANNNYPNSSSVKDSPTTNQEYSTGDLVEPRSLPNSYFILPEPRKDVLFQKSKENKKDLEKKLQN